MKKYIFLLSLLICFKAFSQYAPTSMLDTSFNKNGKLLTTNQIDDFGFAGVTFQNNDKFVTGSVNNERFILVGFNADGSLNKNFGDKGIATFQYQNHQGLSIMRMLTQTDDKVLILTRSKGENYDVLRITKSGIADSTFADDGWLKVNTSLDMALKKGDTIVTATYRNRDGLNNLYYLFQFFDKTGKELHETTVFAYDKWYIPRSRNNSIKLATAQDNKVVLASCTTISAPTLRKGYYVIRLNSNYLPDSTLNGTGIKLVDSLKEELSCMTVDKTNRIIVGQTQNINCIKPNGNFDSSFGNNGKASAIFTYDNFQTNYLTEITVQTDNKVVLFGAAFRYNISNYFALARYKVNGTPDSTYGINGATATTFYENNTVVNSLPKNLAISKENKIVCVGYETAGNLLHGAIAKYIPEKLKSIYISFNSYRHWPRRHE